MNREKSFRPGRRLVTTCVCVAMMLALGTTAAFAEGEVEVIDEPVVDKEHPNFCDFFSLTDKEIDSKSSSQKAEDNFYVTAQRAGDLSERELKRQLQPIKKSFFKSRAKK